MKKIKPKIIKSNFSIDKRGKITFFNDFNFKDIKRFYQIENSSQKQIRAFHGHLKEAKYVYVVKGSLLLILAPLDNPKKPKRKSKLYKYVLKAEKPEIIYIPPGFVNGFKTLEQKTKVLFFSTKTLIESEKDDYRLPYDYWGKDIWKTKI